MSVQHALVSVFSPGLCFIGSVHAARPAAVAAYCAGKKMSGKKWEGRSLIFCRPCSCLSLLTALLLAPLAAMSAGAQAEAARWTAAKFGGVAETPPEAPPGRHPLTTEPPFSFTCGGKSFRDLAWKPARASRRLDDCRTEHTLTYADDKTGLHVRCVAVEYLDFPAVEWTVYFRNAGTSSTPILERIQGLDARFERGADGEFVLHGIKGDFEKAEGYEPWRQMLASQAVAK